MCLIFLLPDFFLVYQPFFSGLIIVTVFHLSLLKLKYVVVILSLPPPKFVVVYYYFFYLFSD